MELYQEYIDEFSKQVGLTRAPETLHNHQASYNRLKKFIQAYYNADDIALRQLDYSFIEKYEHYLRVNMKRSLSTIDGVTIMLKPSSREPLHREPSSRSPLLAISPKRR